MGTCVMIQLGISISVIMAMGMELKMDSGLEMRIRYKLIQDPNS